MIKYISLGFSALLVCADQLIKQQVMQTLARTGQVRVVENFFYLTYVENRGAAFGILQNSTTLLSIITSLVLVTAILGILIGRIKSRFLICSLSLVIAGGLGNLIDRIFRGYVIDYLDFGALFGFPVFNFADCCVVVGTILLLCGIVWLDKSGSKQETHPRETEA